MKQIKIKFDKYSYVVYYVDSRGNEGEIAYGATGSSMEEHAKNLYELGQALQVKIEMERG